LLGAVLFGEAIDAQDGIAVQRSRGKIEFLAVTLLLLTATASFAASPPGAAVSGIVRDAQGVAQMGALVQVVAGGSGVTGSAFTDLNGRYMIAHLLPGRYEVTASATLFLPAMRNNLQLRSGAQAVVNLTLNTLFDTTAWLPAERRKADEPSDDWKWTLGAAVNRPILRWDENGDVMGPVRDPESSRHPNRVYVAVKSGTGGFGEGGVHTTLGMNRTLHDGTDMTLRADVGAGGAAFAGGPSTEVASGYQRQLGFAGEARTVVSYQSHPELVSSNGSNGLEAVRLSGAQKMEMGDMAEVEVGGTVYVLHTSGFVSASQPFLKVSAHPDAVWTVGYRLATSQDLQAFNGLDGVQQKLPVAVMYQGRLQTERGIHQEVAVGRKVRSGLIQVAYYRDSLDRVMVSGGGSPSLSNIAQGDEAGSGVIEDASTGDFRLLGNGYKTQGVNITWTEPITPKMWMALEYSTGAALAAQDGASMSLANAGNNLIAQTGQSATIALKGNVVRSGTSIRAAYRWQPSRLVTAIDPYAAFGDQAYLSCYLRQAIRMGHFLPPGLDATVDVTNLLAQGYRPFLLADGQTLFLAQSPRAVQAGLAFTF
jgi:hypothetical protein